MALFKYAGTKDELDQVPVKNGFVYICSDGTEMDSENNVLGEWYADIGNTRYRLAAAALIGPDGEIVNIEDLVQQGDILEVVQGGTGKASVTSNALLLGNGDGVMSELPATTGVLQVASDGDAPTYGTAPLSMGGTGATTAAAARANLEVYSTTETDNEIETATTTRIYNGSANITLLLESWREDSANERFYQDVFINGLTCGADGDIPPIISIADEENATVETREELEQAYSCVYRAYATPSATPGESKITFYASEIPEIPIPLIVVDNR